MGILFLLLAATVFASCPSSTINVERTLNHRYIFNSSVADDGQLRLIRGCSYDFVLTSLSGSCGFQIVTSFLWGSLYNWKRAKDPQIAPGVKNAGCVAPCVVRYDVPLDAPSLLFWQCASHPKIRGKIETHPLSSWQFTSEGNNGTVTKTSAEETVSYTGAIIVGFCLLLLLIVCVAMAFYFNRENQRTSYHEKSQLNIMAPSEDNLNDRIENENANLRVPLSPPTGHQSDPREY